MTVTDQPVARNSKRKYGAVLAVLAAVLVIAGAAVGATLLLTKKHTPTTNNSKNVSAQSPDTTSNTTSTSQYKLAACTSGTTQTIDNASYVIGTEFAPGSYKVVSQAGDIGWTNINIYNSKATWVQQGSPSVEQGNPDQSFAPDNGTTTYTKLTDGQFMQVDSDPAIFTCE